MLSYLLYAVFILACFVLVVAVLLQPGKADAGALFTSSVSSTAFGPRGTQSVLARITIGAAAAFLLTALLLTMGVGGTGSVMDRGGAAPAASPAASPAADAQPAASPAGEAAPAAEASPAAPAASPAASPAQ